MIVDIQGVFFICFKFGLMDQIWCFGLVIWLRIFGRPVFIDSVVWFLFIRSPGFGLMDPPRNGDFSAKAKLQNLLATLTGDHKLNQCDQIWQSVAILAIFGGVWQQFCCQKSPVHKSFDLDILGFGKFIYVPWQQIWRFLPKCWQLFGLNTRGPFHKS